MAKEKTEQTCKECGLTNLVFGHYNCTDCRAYNLIEESTKATKKKGNKKWLS